MQGPTRISNNLHDHLFRESLSLVEVARSFLQAHLPSEILNQVDLQQIVLCNKSYVDEELKEQVCDVLYATKTTTGKPCYLYLLIEHQSRPLAFMPLRMVRYQTAIMKQHTEQFPEDPYLPIVFPILYYHGARTPYPHSLQFFDLFENTDLAKRTFATSAHLVDLSQLSDEEIKKHPLIAFLELTQKHIYDPNFLLILPHLSAISEDLNHLAVSPEILLRYEEVVLFYIAKVSNIEDFKLFQKELEKNHFIKEKKLMSTIATKLIQEGLLQGINQGKAEGLMEGLERGIKRGLERGIKRGLERGMERGIERGMERGMEIVAKNMLSRGFPIKEIAKCTNLSESQIEAIQKNLKKRKARSLKPIPNPEVDT